MRVVALVACFSALSASWPGGAAAQLPDTHRVVPSSGVEALLDARYQVVDGIGASPLRAGQAGLGVDAHWAPTRGLELGLGWGVRGSAVSLQGIGSRLRFGLPPWRVWVGTGGEVGAWALGLRLIGGTSLALLGAEAATSNGEQAFAEALGSAMRRWDAVRMEGRVGAGGAYAGEHAFSGVVRVLLTAEVGRSSSVLRAVMSAAGAWATDLGLGGEIGAGVALAFSESTLRIVLAGRPWRDPTGELAALRVSWQWGA